MNRTVAATALMMTKGLGRRTLAKFVDRVPPNLIGDIVRNSDLAQLERFGLSLELASRLRESLAGAMRAGDELDRISATAVFRSEDRYPSRLRRCLGEDAPPIIFVIGNLDLVDQAAVGFCGSRRASEKGLRVAKEASSLLATEGVTIVSGYASGVDLAVHRGSLEAGGTTIFVLAEGILHFRVKRDVAPLFTNSNSLVVSEFPPGLPWLARSAMQRNCTIIGLSDAMIVIESGMSGGTFACGEATLNQKRPLFVADYAVPADSAEGNQHFLTRGAAPLRGNREGVPMLGRVLEVVKSGESRARVSKSSSTLFPID